MSHPRAMVRHTEYHSDVEEDFTKPYRPAAFAEMSNGRTLPYWCHMFALSLTGAAREWFKKLPDGQIKSWDDLVAKFSQHFSQQKKHARDPSEILDVVRRDNEYIKDFVSRFNVESLNIGGISADMLRRAFRRNVQSNALIRCVTGKDGMPKAWDDIMSAAKLFARTEKTLGFESLKRKAKVEFQSTWMNKPARGSIWSRLQPPVEVSKKPDERTIIGNKNKAKTFTQSSNSWTPLTKTPSEILTTEYLNFKKPQPLMKRAHLNPNKHCMFHDDIGHHTDDCVTLKNEIEAAVKSTKLEHLVKKSNARDSQTSRTNQSSPASKPGHGFERPYDQGGRVRGTKGKRLMRKKEKVNP
ncbi:uncharacterized protein LOC143584212 [Bidens hawaiensis]|uniref:uncharacterized protein LOC143584212 n=1 Tax=Bidens hawaiensis TaxID=980011 RepID=UPI0040494B31